MSKINNYEALVRNFSGYEEALLKATHGAEVPYRHLSAAITVEKDEEKRTLLVNSKTFGPYSGGPIGYDAGNCAMIKLNDFLVDAGKLTGWSVKSIEISESELSLLSSVSKLPVFDDYANQRKTILDGALSQMFKAFSVASGNDETALNIDNTDNSVATQCVYTGMRRTCTISAETSDVKATTAAAGSAGPALSFRTSWHFALRPVCICTKRMEAVPDR